MEKLTKEDLLILSAYTGYFIGINTKELKQFINETMEMQVTPVHMLDRKFLAILKGKLYHRYKTVCSKLKRMVE